MSAPTLVPVDHSIHVQHSFYVMARCVCGGRLYVGRVDQDHHQAETTEAGDHFLFTSFALGLWHAYEPDGTMAGTVATLIDAIHALTERAHHEPKEKDT